jgi:hypothetical protein
MLFIQGGARTDKTFNAVPTPAFFYDQK